jgi:hypothetical protein
MPKNLATIPLVPRFPSLAFLPSVRRRRGSRMG